MIKYALVFAKNGKEEIGYIYRIDDSKPKCYREGFEYKFNSEIVASFKLKLSGGS